MTAVRPGTGLDEDAALTVWQAAEAGAGRRSGGTRAQRVRARLRSPAALLLVAERDGGDGRTPTPVGVLLAELDRTHGLVVALLAVDPPAQCTGVGRALLEALLSRYPSAAARVASDDVASLGLLAAVGLEQVDTQEQDGWTLWQRPATTATTALVGTADVLLEPACGAKGNAAPPEVVGSGCDDGQP